jgi:hypothetical protein
VGSGRRETTQTSYRISLDHHTWKEKELIDWLFAHRKMGGEGTEATD